MRSGDSSPCAFASAPLRGGVRPLGGTLRLALGLPGHMQPHRAAVHVTGWLIYTAQEGDVAPLLFPAMHTTLHVLHCAHSDALGGTPAAALAQGGAADAMAPLHLRVWLPAGTAAAEALAQCCGFVAGSASASAVAGARALLPCTAGAAPPGSLRCAMSREGAAHFTVAAGSEPHIAPLVRSHIPSLSMSLSLSDALTVLRRRARRCFAAASSGHWRSRRRRRRRRRRSARMLLTPCRMPRALCASSWWAARTRWTRWPGCARWRRTLDPPHWNDNAPLTQPVRHFKPRRRSC